MKGTTLKRYISLHTWTGLAGGWALFIAFFAGSILIFYDALNEWADPSSRRGVSYATSQQALSQVDALIQKVLADQPEIAHEIDIEIPTTGNAVLYWHKIVDGVQTDEHEVHVFVAGQLAPHDARPAVLPDFIYQLHYSLGLPNPYGMYLLGLICVLYGLALVSGIVIHAPQLIKDLFALRLGHNLKRLWQDAHNVIGVLSLPFHIVYAYTGALFCVLTLLAMSMNYLALGNRSTKDIEQIFEITAIPEASGVKATMLPFSELLATAKQTAPGFTPTFLTFHHYGDENARVIFYGDLKSDGPEERGLIESARMVLNANTGDVEGKAIPGDAPLALASMGVMMGLHFGHFGGPLIQWMYFILGLAGAFLFYSGNLLWIESRRKRQSIHQPRVHRVMAQLTVGICLGCCLGIATLFITNKLPAFAAAELNEKIVYYCVFLGAIVYALTQSPARAALHLLSATAVAAVLIPVMNALTTGDHFIRSANAGLWNVFFIDLTAIVMALAFALLARVTYRRAYQGDPNSVWALPLDTVTAQSQCMNL
jgi:uncharacterized iron-regulated membrane protein